MTTTGTALARCGGVGAVFAEAGSTSWWGRLGEGDWSGKKDRGESQDRE